MTETDITDVGTQALPLDLPEYHGRKPIGQKTALNGAGNRIVREHAIGDRVVLVVEAKVRKAGHEDTDDGLVYTETLKVVDLFEVEAKAASRLLATMRQTARTKADAGKRTPMVAEDGTDMGEVGYTDANGVVLTPAELAEMRGDPVTAITGAHPPVVVLFADGARSLWPDEFADGVARPTVGSFVLDGDAPREVVSVVDAVTGEDVDAAPDEAAADVDDPPVIPEEHLPTAADFDFVDRDIAVILDDLEDIDDMVALERIRNAEKQGRGRALKPRKGALAAIDDRIARVAGSVKLKLVQEG